MVSYRKRARAVDANARDSGRRDAAPAQSARALAHPVRARILAALGEAESSPLELAKTLGLRLGVVSYHVRVLAKAGVIELSRTSVRRGAIQHHYRRCTHVDRYCESVELSPRIADALTSEITAAIGRAQDRDASESARTDDRIAVTVLVQPADERSAAR